MDIYIVYYMDPVYPEDSRIIGAYSSSEKAEAVIESEISFYLAQYGKQNHQTFKHNYGIKQSIVE